MPAGTIVQYGGASAPTDWLLCDGAAVSQATYAALYAIIGLTYGNPGGGNFNLPDLRRRVPVGKGSGGAVSTLGENDGVAEALRRGTKHRHTAHSHSITDPGHIHGVTDPGHAHSLSTWNGAGGPMLSDGASNAGSQVVLSTNGAATGISINSNSTGITGTVGADGGSAIGTDPLDGGAFLVVNFIIHI
jgi:microcystin-dependent protein